MPDGHCRRPRALCVRCPCGNDGNWSSIAAKRRSRVAFRTAPTKRWRPACHWAAVAEAECRCPQPCAGVVCRTRDAAQPRANAPACPIRARRCGCRHVRHRGACRPSAARAGRAVEGHGGAIRSESGAVSRWMARCAACFVCRSDAAFLAWCVSCPLLPLGVLHYFMYIRVILAAMHSGVFVARAWKPANGLMKVCVAGTFSRWIPTIMA